MKKNRFSLRRKKVGLAPGSVVFIGERKVDKVFIHHLQYDRNNLNDYILNNQEQIALNESKEEEVDWYDIRGLHDTALIEGIGAKFNIHSLILEDVANTHQRPKYEEYLNGIFVVMRALSFNQKSKEVATEQVALYFRRGLLISFQENESDLFEPIRNRLQLATSRIRQKGTDYLCYALLDSVTDHYYVIMEQIEEEIERLEHGIVEGNSNNIKTEIHKLKKELLLIRKSVSPLREAISKFSKSENDLIDERTKLFTRDLYDHTVQLMDALENQRDILNGLQDLYLSELSFKMNQVMQVLAIITTIFVPLSFLAGLYGMNFENIPELHHPYGYYILLSIMVFIFVGAMAFFKRKGWI